jgi:DNA-binding response OmpR family regulator
MGNSIGRLSGRSVLVVEDEPLIALAVKELFEADGANVDIAFTPHGALGLLDKTVFSAAILDFGTADNDKEQLCRTLRAYGIPFMYYTGYGDIEVRPSGPPVVVKPASGEILITTIAQLLDLRAQPNSSAAKTGESSAAPKCTQLR